MTTMEDDGSASLPSQLSDAVITTVRGGIRILSGIVQVAAGVTKLLAVTAIKAVEAAEEAVEATREDEEESEPKPKLDPL